MNAIQSSLYSSGVAVVGILTALNSFAASAVLEKTGLRNNSFWSDDGGLTTLAEAGDSDRDNHSVIKEGAEVSLIGELKGGKVCIGGEHTGWAVEYQTKAGPQTIEVDISALDVANLHKGLVQIRGKIFKKSYIERGPVLILKAMKITKL